MPQRLIGLEDLRPVQSPLAQRLKTRKPTFLSPAHIRFGMDTASYLPKIGEKPIYRHELYLLCLTNGGVLGNLRDLHARRVGRNEEPRTWQDHGFPMGWDRLLHYCGRGAHRYPQAQQRSTVLPDQGMGLVFGSRHLGGDRGAWGSPRFWFGDHYEADATRMVRTSGHVHYLCRSSDGECDREHYEGRKLGVRTVAFHSRHCNGGRGWIPDYQARSQASEKPARGQRLQGLKPFYS